MMNNQTNKQSVAHFAILLQCLLLQSVLFYVGLSYEMCVLRVEISINLTNQQHFSLVMLKWGQDCLHCSGTSFLLKIYEDISFRTQSNAYILGNSVPAQSSNAKLTWTCFSLFQVQLLSSSHLMPQFKRLGWRSSWAFQGHTWTCLSELWSQSMDIHDRNSILSELC